MHLGNDEFLTKLQELFDSRKAKGSVFLTTKRFTYVDPAEKGEQDVVMSGTTGTDEEDEREWPCLIRATDGKGKESKTKLSTIVQPADYTSFTTAYGTLLKSNMTTMRKKKKTKRKADAKKGKEAYALTKVIGPKKGFAKRGAGVKRRRKLVGKRERELKKLWARKKRESTT